MRRDLGGIERAIGPAPSAPATRTKVSCKVCNLGPAIHATTLRPVSAEEAHAAGAVRKADGSAVLLLCATCYESAFRSGKVDFSDLRRSLRLRALELELGPVGAP